MARDVQPTQTEDVEPRYVVGIDLGTTNCAVAYVDLHAAELQIKTFPILQFTALGEQEQRNTLPSFAYMPSDAERKSHPSQLPWQKKNDDWDIGVIARDHGSRTPGRQIVSAKSWLCHSGVDRLSNLLPWQAGPDVQRVSPVDASALYLSHVRACWDAGNSEFKLADQEIVITIPASFDEVARELTISAARASGLGRVTLIEEPQAAFYAWLHRHRDDWQEIVSPGQIILVCDVGGGTSDFTLIQARPDESAPAGIRFHRLAVGDHLILGGDNLDLALAHHAETQLSQSGKLASSDWDRLIRQCRVAKEQALGDDAPDSISIHLSGKGSKLLGGAKQTRLETDQVKKVLLDGFFPMVDLDSTPQSQSVGLTEFGLPYAQDPAITRHLAYFLKQHEHDLRQREVEASDGLPDNLTRPDILLFNGGTFESPQIRDRLIDQIHHWYGGSESADWSLHCLESDRLNLAVSEGAAVFGLARRGEGVRISAGLARSYYVGVAGDRAHAVCLLPAGIEPGSPIELHEPQFNLKVGTPIQFPIFSSSTRINDAAGDIIDVDGEQMKSLPPIRTVVETKKQDDAIEKAIEMHAELTEVGTMDLACHEIGGEGKWKLQFDVRSATQTDAVASESTGEAAGLLDESIWQECQTLIQDTFSDRKSNPDKLTGRIGEILGESRNNWRPSLLRRMWEELLNMPEARNLSAKHEARWLNMVGFFLRPGYGMAMDDWRVATTWRIVQGKLIHATARARTESWILWRRIAGGLTSGQQLTLASPLLNAVRQVHRQVTTGRGKGSQVEFGSHEAAEVWRMLGSLERLPQRNKIELGEMILDLMTKKRFQPSRDGMIWALGRLGSRRPIYGLLNDVLPAETIESWLRRLIKEGRAEGIEKLAMMQLARRCDDRYRDIDDSTRQDVISWLTSNDASSTLVSLVADGGTLDSDQQERVLGDALPIGLSLRSL